MKDSVCVHKLSLKPGAWLFPVGHYDKQTKMLCPRPSIFFSRKTKPYNLKEVSYVGNEPLGARPRSPSCSQFNS